MNSQPQTIFRAVADPTRRAIIDLLAGQELTANEVAAEFSISRPAISRHLRILKEGGIVVERADGRRRYNRLNAPNLKIIYDWLKHYERFWDQALTTLKTQIEQDLKSGKETEA